MALWCHDARRATAALERHRATPFRGRAFEATNTALAAGLAALDGRTDEAHAGYRIALRAFETLGLRIDGALVGLDMAQLLDPADPEVATAAAAARAATGARPFIARLDAALAPAGERV